jgi:hypothetical protein
MYEQKRNDFAALLKRHGTLTTKWLAMPRDPVIEGKEVMSIYKHNGDEGMGFAKCETASNLLVVPSVASLVNAMKQSNEKIQIKGKSLLKKKVRDWLLGGILIEQER